MSLNKVLLLGNLVRDPEVRYSPKGTAYAKFSLATTTSYQHNGEKKEETAFIDVTVFGKTAEKIGENCKKGTPIFVEGRLKLDTWVDKQTQQNRSKLSVMAEYCRLAQPGAGDSSPRSTPSAPPGPRPAPAAQPNLPASDAPDMPPDEDDVPF